MAPELRTRKLKVKTTMAAAKGSGKPAKSPKRKASDDSSAATTKKNRVSKPTRGHESKLGIGADEASPFEAEEEEQGDAASAAMLRLIDSDNESNDNLDYQNYQADDSTGAEDKDAIANVPKVPRHEKPAKKKNQEPAGVIYVGRIPHGFYEHQMREYFSQFGDINKLRLSRNRKTGASKHYAFIEFAEESTAEIVAKTMDNYLLFSHILKVKMLSRDQIHPDLWKGCNRRYKVVPWKKLEASKLARPRTEEQWNKAMAKESRRRSKLATKLKSMDYEFSIPTLVAPPQPIAMITRAEDSTKDTETPLAVKATGKLTR